MSTLRNTVNLIGHLGMDPIVTKFGEDKSLARFSLATNESYKNKSGEWTTETTWHNIIAWGKTAELCDRLLKKGLEVAVKGKIVYDQYESKEGEKRYKTEISIKEFIVLNKQKTSENTK